SRPGGIDLPPPRGGDRRSESGDGGGRDPGSNGAAVTRQPVWDEKGLVAAVVQDAETSRVLMLGWMNEEALAATQESGRVTFWSRSRQELWEKGATSGNWLELESIQVDCDGDALLVRAIPHGPVCHTGSATCWE